MEGIKSQVLPADINSDFIQLAQLTDKMAERKAFNELLRATVYGSEIYEEFSTFSTTNAVVWIDPLDGTKDFTMGNLSAVTVLIGLAIDGVPKIGVVHNPFKTNENDGRGSTIFGTQEHGAFLLDFNSSMDKQELLARVPCYISPFDLEQQFGEDHKIKAACSLSHFNATMQQTIEQLAPVEICRLGGAGNKVCRIALSEVDSYVQPAPGLGFWDLCGPEAIVRAMGGLCTDFNGKRLLYHPSLKPTLPSFCIGKTKNQHTEIMRRLKLIKQAVL